jgi:hypothetical protein
MRWHSNECPWGKLLGKVFEGIFFSLPYALSILGIITYRAKLLDADWLMKEGFFP